MRRTYRIILAEDHVRFRTEIKKVINEIPGVKVVGEVGNGDELFELLESSRPDLLLLDISMPNLRAMKATQKIKAIYPEVKVIIMAMDGENEYRASALSVGADGMLLKQNSARDLETAIRQLRCGESYFPILEEERVIPDVTGKFRSFDFFSLLSFC